MRIAEYLAEQQVPFESLPHPLAFSAQKLARCLHVKGSEVAKALLLHGPKGFFMAVLPATHHADLPALEAHMGAPVRLASAEEMVSVFRDCEWGAVSPFGNLYGLPTLLDASMTAEMWIVVEAGSHVEAVSLSRMKLLRTTALALLLGAAAPGQEIADLGTRTDGPPPRILDRDAAARFDFAKQGLEDFAGIPGVVVHAIADKEVDTVVAERWSKKIRLQKSCVDNSVALTETVRQLQRVEADVPAQNSPIPRQTKEIRQLAGAPRARWRR